MKKILSTFTILCLSTTMFSTMSFADNDYDSNYYKEEGDILFKVRGSGIFTKGKVSDLPRPNSRQGLASPKKVTGLISNGYGLDGSTTVFFSKNIAAELGVGLQLYKTSASSVQSVSYNYGNRGNTSKKKNIYAVPLSLTFQYHVAPFGAIRPYLGAGYQYTWTLSKSKQFVLEGGHGYVCQAGVDFALSDDTLLSFDVKRFQFTPKVKYKDSFLGQGYGFTAKTKINPVIVSFGIGWKF